MKKVLSILLAVLLLATLFAGCKAKSKNPDATTEANEPAENESGETNTVESEPVETTPAEEDGIFVTYNGQNIKVGVPFTEMQDMLGEETQPAETIDSCDEGSDWKQTMHFYSGMIVTENKDGIIDGIQVQEGEAALMGKIKIGASKDDVKAVLGEPDTDESWGIYYEKTNPMVNFYLDDETGLISGFALMAGAEG